MLQGPPMAFELLLLLLLLLMMMFMVSPP